jgi:hypothetical protein
MALTKEEMKNSVWLKPELVAIRCPFSELDLMNSSGPGRSCARREGPAPLTGRPQSFDYAPGRWQDRRHAARSFLGAA